MSAGPASGPLPNLRFSDRGLLIQHKGRAFVQAVERADEGERGPRVSMAGEILQFDDVAAV